MTHTLSGDGTALAPAPAPARPGVGGLLRAEVFRFAARRLVRVFALLAAACFAAGLTIAWFQYAEPSAADMAVAADRAAQARVEAEAGRQQCLADPQRPPGVAADEFCGPPVRGEDFAAVDFLEQPAFQLATNLPAGVLPIGALSAAMAFVLGASWIGAEWSSRSMVALLFWEPRRLRVLAVKTAVIAAAGALLGVLAQAAWTAGAVLLARFRGATGQLEPGFWGDLLASQSRTVVLVVLVALLGFGLANLARHTAAALGVAFAYLLLVESAVRAFRPRWSQYLFGENAAGLVAEGGARVAVPSGGSGSEDYTAFREIVISNPRGGLTLAAYCALVLLAGAILFRRRDLH